MKLNILAVSVLMSLIAASTSGAAERLSPTDEAAAFKAAGFKKKGKQWRACEDPTPTYGPGTIQEVLDLNGDGQPEAIITEGGTYCYGNTGSGYGLVSKQANGSWKLLSHGIGILSILPTKGVDGWPDLEIGGPGFCFPVERWNGKKYALNRHQYEGKPCNPK
ncbi:hypothetical protein [Chitinivorax sp. B]|uniref:hypothetical protein n=1 Tax=Chitinivorax sp. B TaxID=2502235 RepID=UPI0010F7EAE7|nr:hypothetical protein [Chitinivorax sp. B]